MKYNLLIPDKGKNITQPKASAATVKPSINLILFM